MDDNFLDLLKTIANNYTFEYSFFDTKKQSIATLPCKCLTMSDLNQIIEVSLNDNSVQVGFYSAITDIFARSLLDATDREFNIIDRLLYILQVRAASVSSTKTFADEDEPITIDFKNMVKKLQEAIVKNSEWFSPKTFSYDNMSITCDIPTVKSDVLVGEQFYKYLALDMDDEEDVKTFIGQNFMIELAKCLKTLVVGESTLDFSTLSFEDRIKTIEQLPVLLMQDVISYNKNYKKFINESITINDFLLPINGSLFLE